MIDESALREKLATCTRIFAMQGLIGLFGHVSVFDPETRRVLVTPTLGRDKATLRGEDMLVMDLSGKILEGGQKQPPLEWPIHTALHATRKDALAVAHLHSPHATLFAIAKRPFRPVTLEGTIFADGVPVYPEAALIRTVDQGKRVAALIGHRRAALLRGHGIVAVAKDIEELLYSTLILEDNARKTMQAAALGEVGFLTPEDCRAFDAGMAFDRRAQRAWLYFTGLESRWDRQPATGIATFA